MSSIRCYLEVFGRDFDPNTLTEALGIEPTRTWRYGDVSPGMTMPLQYDGWSIDSGEVESRDLDEVAFPILKHLLPAADILVEHCDRLDLEVGLSCAVYVKVGQMPAISLDSTSVRMLSALGASLDVGVWNFGAGDGHP